MQAPSAITLYRHPLSGHCHRVELMLSLLGLSAELVNIDLKKREQKSPEFLALNAFGQIPVLRDGDVVVADANAILVYLVSRYAPNTWLPQEPSQAAQVQRWLSVAAGPLAFGPAAARLAVLLKAPINIEEATARAVALLNVMEQTFSDGRPFLIGESVTLADIANYSYVARASEGNISLDPFPKTQAWLTRVEALPGFIAMPWAHTLL